MFFLLNILQPSYGVLYIHQSRNGIFASKLHILLAVEQNVLKQFSNHNVMFC